MIEKNMRFLLKIGLSLKIHEKQVSVFQRQLACCYCINSGSLHAAKNYCEMPTIIIVSACNKKSVKNRFGYYTVAAVGMPLLIIK
jgi:hypothetical protein